MDQPKSSRRDSTEGGDSVQLDLPMASGMSSNSEMEIINGLVDRLVLLTTNRQRNLSGNSNSTRPSALIWDGQVTELGRRVLPRQDHMTHYRLTGPNEAKVSDLLRRTGYELTISPRQRMYGHPPPNWSGPEPASGCQVFVGKIPKQLFEDTLIPLFEKVGKIFGMRLMMEGSPSVVSRGFAFVTYTTRDDAIKAEQTLDGHEILKGRKIKVAVSEPVKKLLLRNIPRNKTAEEIQMYLIAAVPGIVSVTAEPSGTDPNNGTCIVEFDAHTSASFARKRLCQGAVTIFSQVVFADWADPIVVADETLKNIRSICVQGLTSGMTYKKIYDVFAVYGDLEKVRFLKPGTKAIITYREESDAERAKIAMNNKEIEGNIVNVSLMKEEVAIQTSKQWNPRDKVRRTQLIAPAVMNVQLCSHPSTSTGAIGGRHRRVPHRLPSEFP